MIGSIARPPLTSNVGGRSPATRASPVIVTANEPLYVSHSLSKRSRTTRGSWNGSPAGCGSVGIAPNTARTASTWANEPRRIDEIRSDGSEHEVNDTCISSAR